MKRALATAAVALAATASCVVQPARAVRNDTASRISVPAIRGEQRDTLAALARLERERLAAVFAADVFSDAAAAAWAFADNRYLPSSGMIRAVNNYPNATVWDIGSMIAALYCGRQLGLIEPAAYDARMSTLLDTLGRMPLYDGAVFNKLYDARSGSMIGRDERPTSRGYGWSATDLGRLLIWLKIVRESDARWRARADAIVARLAMSRVVRVGYLHGEDVRGDRPHTYQEARIGYEQYAAHGFALWGHTPERALAVRTNALPLWVYGQPLLADFRGDDRLTSEPYLLMGLELGWDAQAAALARSLLLAQQTRYLKTGAVTLVSEDAIAEPPAYFYYYSVFTKGQQFGIDVQDPRLVVDGPRWVSTKAAFGYHALLPGWYTQLAVETVRPARSASGWASGVYEESGRSTGTDNINTAAVVLTAALYARDGRPILAAARAQGE